MAFLPENFLMAERALDQISVDATASFTNMDRAVDQLSSASAALAAMTAAWTPAVNYITAEAAAAPGDAGWQSLLARKDKLVADFLAMQTLVQAVRTAAITARG